VDVPDLRSADLRTLIEMRAHHLHLLASLGEDAALQIQWTAEDDFGPALDRYAASKSEGSPWCRRTCAVRRAYYGRRLKEGSLRRDRVRIFLGRRCEALRGADIRTVAACETYLAQASAALETHLKSLAMALPFARFDLLDDGGHALVLRKFLNPSLASLLAGDRREALDGFTPERSVRANCLRAGIEAFTERRGGEGGGLLFFDGCFHALFVMRELPRGTRPGMLLPVIDAVPRGAALTVAVRPLSVDREIDRLRREIEELSAFVNDRRAVGIENDLQLRRSRIDSLLSAVTIPFRMLFIARVWGATPEELSVRALALRTALHRLDGAVFVRVDSRVAARQLFYETLPGYFGTEYRDWDIYAENRNLADLLPISSTFSGHLEQAQAVYDSPSGSVVGIRLIAANGTPQHSIVVGVNGSGKSAFLMDLMSQSDCSWSYRFFQEEGLAFATQAQLCGMASLVLRESGGPTINPFDTLGLPLSSATIAAVVRICMQLVGRSRDEDRNRRREGLIGDYVHAHCADCAEDWKLADEERWHRLARRALAAERLRAPGEDFLDGYLALRDLERTEPAAAQERIAAALEADVAAFAAHPPGRSSVEAMVFTELRAEEYPQFSGLVALLRHGRRSHHRSAGVAEELDYLSSELAKGRQVGGLVGPFLDGVTTIDLRGAGLHFDTSRLQDGLLKSVASFTVFERVRQHVLSLPRAQAKVMLLDELRRILMIPSAGEFVKELLAQMRKYRCVFIGAFQEPSQIDDLDPLLTELLLGQCKQYFLMRQNNAGQVGRIARVIGLPEVAQRAVLQHPLIEHQVSRPRASYFTYFSRETGAPLCGTVRVEVDPAMLYVAESSGEIFDGRAAALRRYPTPYAGVLAEASAASKT